MTPAELLARLRKAGITTAVTEDGELRLRGPDAALTDRLVRKAREHRDQLIELIRAEMDGASNGPANNSTASHGKTDGADYVLVSNTADISAVIEAVRSA